MRTPTHLLALALCAIIVTPTLQAQSAQDVFERMLAEHDRRAAGIDNYTVVQDAMGQAVTMYFEKDASGPHPVFRVKSVTVAGQRSAGTAGRDDAEAEFWDHLPELMERATYVGRESVEGNAVHVVKIDDLASTGFGRNIAPGNADFEPKSGTFYVDAERWVPRRMVFEGRMKMQGKTVDVTADVIMRDYRTVDGLLHPFVTAVSVDGLADAIDPATRQQYEQMKKQLAEMPESQRQMVEQMMKGQLAQMEKMMTEGGPMNFEMVVRELRVNAGPPK